MTTHWKPGGHWYVGTAEHPATALEITIGNANEFTIGFYNFACFGFYLDATVGPLVEFIAPFPYCVFPGILLEIILPQKQILAAAVVAGVTAASGAVVGELGASAVNPVVGASGGFLAAVGAGAAATAAVEAAIAATAAFPYSACQMDVVYGNYFFTVYGTCHDWQPEGSYEHKAVDHFASAKQKLHNVVNWSTEQVQSKAIFADGGLAIQATDQFSAQGVTVDIFGDTGLTIAATSELAFDAPMVVVQAPEIAVQTPAAAIKVEEAASLVGPALYLNGDHVFEVGEFALVAMDPPPDFAVLVETAENALNTALQAYVEAMEGGGHAAPADHGHAAPADHGHAPPAGGGH